MKNIATEVRNKLKGNEYKRCIGWGSSVFVKVDYAKDVEIS
jgi:hypothetical protein